MWECKGCGETNPDSSYFCQSCGDKNSTTKVSDAKDEIFKEREERIKITENIEQLSSSIIMTTGSLFEGYRVERYMDVICEEIIFKNSFLKRLVADLEDFGNSFSFKEREMSGANELIATATNHVLKKFREHAAKVGANAVLGIEFESSFGSDVVRVAVFGTAVVIAKIDNETKSE